MEEKVIVAGIDAGSRAIKIILLNGENLEVISAGIRDQGIEQDSLTRELYENLLKESNISPDKVSKIISTGYGRNIVSFADATFTEIKCHAFGVCHLIPGARTIIDIGGQDSKIIILDEKGRVQDFAMNDRCAAGTGRFLEVVAERLKLDISELGEVAQKSQKPKVISSTCVVFAETEITGLLASGSPVGDIIAGVIKSIATRVVGMGGRLIQSPIVFTGGVALIPGMREALQLSLQQNIITSPTPQYTGALGAALLALGD